MFFFLYIRSFFWLAVTGYKSTSVYSF